MKAQSFVTPIVIIAVLAGTFMILSKNPNEAPVSSDQLANQSNNRTEEITPELQISPVVTQTNKSMDKLKIEDIKVGTGPEVKSGDTISINYLGTLEDGKKFDSSYDRGQPFETKIGVGQVIQGWDQGVVGMKVGGKRKLTIPSSLAYGDRGIPGVIPPKATLIFEVELMGIK